MVANAPTYRIAGAFIPQTWQTAVNSALGWPEVLGYNWEDYIGGPIPTQDVVAFGCRRAVSDMFGRLQIGEAEVMLEVEHNAYAPDNASAPYRIKVNDILTIKAISPVGSVYALFTGAVDRVAMRPQQGRRSITVLASDVGRALSRDVSTGLQFETRQNSLIAVVQEKVEALKGRVDVDPTISDAVPFGFLDSIQAGEAFDQIAKSGAHSLYIDGNNRLKFINRNFDLNVAAVASYDNLAYDMDYGYSASGIVNHAKITGNPRAPLGATTSLAALQRVTPIDPGNTLTFFMQYRDPNTGESPVPARNVEAPVNSADYYITSDPIGSRGNIGGSLQVVTVSFAVSALVEITNPSSAQVYVQKFVINGEPIVRTAQIQSEHKSDASINAYDQRMFSFESDLIFDPFFADALAQYIVSRRSAPRSQLSHVIRNEFPDCYALDLLQTIAVTESYTGVASLFVIRAIDHSVEMRGGGLTHTLKMDCDIADTKTYLTLDHSTKGKLDQRLLGF